MRVLSLIKKNLSSNKRRIHL